MNKKIIRYLILTFIILSSIFTGVGVLKAQDKTRTQTVDVSGQLQQILQNQQVILAKLNEIKEELRIIKVRSTIKR